MWHDLFAAQIPYAEKVLRTVLVYALIVVLFRVAGRRSLTGLNSLDLVVMFLLSNVVQNAIIGNDNSFTGGAVGAVTLVAVNSAINRLALRSDWFARIFEGTDTTVISAGQIDARAVSRIGLRRHDLERAVRLQNGESVDDVQSGVFDPDGHLLLTLRPGSQAASRADLDRLQAQLDRIEAALSRT